jgi:hypothetical protein
MVLSESGADMSVWDTANITTTIALAQNVLMTLWARPEMFPSFTRQLCLYFLILLCIYRAILMYVKDVSKFVSSLYGFTFMYASSQAISVDSIHFGSNSPDNWKISTLRTFPRISARSQDLLLVEFLRTRKSSLFYVNLHWLAKLASPYYATYAYILISCHDNGCIICHVHENNGEMSCAYRNSLSAIYPGPLFNVILLLLFASCFLDVRILYSLALKDSKIG